MTRHWKLPRRTLLAGGVALLVPCAALAQADYPSRPIRLVVPFTAGGGTDILGRLIAERLQERLKQPVLVDNKPGANTVIGTEFVAKAAPDGYTIGLMSSSFSTVPLTTRKSFALVQFTPISQVADFPLVLVANPKVPFASVPELVAYAKANPGKLTYGVSAQGGADHMTGELFKMRAGVDIRTVPYKGSAQALTDLVGGQIDLRWDTLPGARPFLASGQLRALGLTSAGRSPLAPEIPSIFEGGALPDFSIPFYYGMVGPAGLPREITTRLSNEVAQILQQPAVQERMRALGLVPRASKPEEFGQYLELNTDLWAKVVQQAKISAE